MRLLVICAHYPPMLAPEGVHARMLCERLAEHGIETHLLTSALAEPAPARGFTLHPEMPDWTWRNRSRLLRSMQSINPDVVLLIYVGWVYGEHPMITFAPTYLRRMGSGARFVAQFENVMGAKVGSLKRRMLWAFAAAAMNPRNVSVAYGSLLRDSHAIVALSELHLREILQALPAAQEKSTVIPAPPLLEVLPDPEGAVRSAGRKRLGIQNGGSFVFTYFGHIYPGKGVEHLLPAFAQVRHMLAGAEEMKPRLVLIGKGQPAIEQQLRRQASDLKIEADITWTGHCDAVGSCASTYLRASDVVVLPFDQGLRLNNSSFSACIAHGLPVVTTRGDEMESAFVDGTNVLLCPAREPDALAQAMLKTATSPELRARLSQGATRLSRDALSWEKNIASTLRVLRGDAG